MAGFAGAAAVRAAQWKVSFCRMIKDRTGPVLLTVATLAVMSIATQVDILELVTSDTLRVVKFILLARMTTAALQFLMTTL